jgi:hypothetical protein
MIISKNKNIHNILIDKIPDMKKTDNKTKMDEGGKKSEILLQNTNFELKKEM